MSPPAPPLNFLAALTRAATLINTLALTYLPKESGFIGILGKSSQLVKTTTSSAADGRDLAAQSHNYYMLTADYPINYLHWLESDDTHVLVEGGPLDYFIFHPEVGGVDARVEKVTLGTDVENGQRPIVAVPGGCWKALKLAEGVAFALTVNVLSPEFTEDRVRIGESDNWIGSYVGKTKWATRDFLRELVGPNLKQSK